MLCIHFLTCYSMVCSICSIVCKLDRVTLKCYRIRLLNTRVVKTVFKNAPFCRCSNTIGTAMLFSCPPHPPPLNFALAVTTGQLANDKRLLIFRQRPPTSCVLCLLYELSSPPTSPFARFTPYSSCRRRRNRARVKIKWTCRWAALN
jgi:hypothetical protein